MDLKDIFNQTYVNKLKMFEEDEDFEINLEELEMLDEAYQNAYLVATEKITVKELLEENGEMVFLPFNPEAQKLL